MLYDTEGRKRCTKCGEYKELDDYRFHRGYPIGKCRECLNPLRRAQKKRAARRKKVKLVGKETQVCAACEKKLPVGAFKLRKGSESILMPWCVPCGQKPESLTIVEGKVGAHEGVDAYVASVIICHLRTRSFKTGNFCTLAPEDLLPLPRRCPATGVYLDYSSRLRPHFPHNPGRGYNPNSASVDRIDPELFYTPGNVVIISNRANTIKNDLGATELQKVARFYASQS